MKNSAEIAARTSRLKYKFSIARAMFSRCCELVERGCVHVGRCSAEMKNEHGATAVTKYSTYGEFIPPVRACACACVCALSLSARHVRDVFISTTKDLHFAHIFRFSKKKKKKKKKASLTSNTRSLPSSTTGIPP